MKSFKISLTVLIGIFVLLGLTLSPQSCRLSDYTDALPKMLLLLSGVWLEMRPLRFAPFGRFSCAWACWLALALSVPGNLPLLLGTAFLCLAAESRLFYKKCPPAPARPEAAQPGPSEAAPPTLSFDISGIKPKREAAPGQTALLSEGCRLLALALSLWTAAQTGISPEGADPLTDSLKPLQGSFRLNEEVIPALAAVALYPLLNTVLPFIFIPGLKSASDPETALRGQRLSICALCLGILGFAAYKSLYGQPCLFALLLVAVICCRSWGRSVYQSEDWLRSRRLSRSLEKKDKKLLAAQRDCSELSLQLRSDRQDRQIVGIIEQELARKDSEQTLKTALSLIAKLVKTEQAAIFSDTGGSLLPRLYLKDDELLENWELLRLQEPILNWAYQNRKCLTSQELAESGWELPQSHLAYPFQIALFMPESSVLWLGRAGKPFNERETRLLKEAALKIGLADRESRYAEDLNRQLRELAEANACLSAWNERINGFLAGLSRALDLSSGKAALEEIEGLIKTTIDADFVFFLFGNLRSGEDRAPLSEAELRPFESAESRRALEELQQCVCRSRRPLLIDDLRKSRFKAPHRDIISILAVPVMNQALKEAGGQSDSEAGDALILGACREDAFSRQDQDIMQMLAERLDVIIRSHRLHLQLRKANLDLKKSQASLIQAGKMAAIGQMAAGLAHELNTPLGAVILGIDSASLSLKREKPETAFERLESAKKAAQHAQSIIKNLLYYSREEAHKDVRPVNLNTSIEDALALIGHKLKNCGVTVKKCFGDLPLCTVNRSEMQQVFTNLILNACDALKDVNGDRILEISSLKASSGSVELRFADNGCGIEPEHLKHIFEPFFTTKGPGCGTGLGLSVSREIIGKLNGGIRAESEQGRTVFTVSLPCA